MASALEPSTIRCSSPRDVVQHLRAVAKTSSEVEITNQLIHFVDIGLVPPSALAPWLHISPSSLPSALLQDVSIQVRRLAIKQLRKALKSSQWSLPWDLIGGVQGWVDLFGRFSVTEVREACRAIGSSATGIDRDLKREKVAQLFMALHPRLFPEASQLSQDERALNAQYRRLLPSCTKDIIIKVIGKELEGVEGISDGVRRQIFLLHSDTLQAAALRHIFEKSDLEKGWVSPLLQDYPPSTAAAKGFSASMMFSFAVLQRLLEEESQLLSAERCIDELVQPLLKRAVRKKAAWSLKQQIVNLAVKYLKAHPKVANNLGYEHNGFLHSVAECWSSRPELFEKQFTVLLTHSLKKQKRGSFEDFEKLLIGISRSRRYPLLRFCYKVATGRDLDVEEDLKGTKCFLSFRLLEQLQAEKSLGLFNRIRSAQGGDFVGCAPVFDLLLGSGSTLDSKTGDVDMWQTLLLRRAGHHAEAKGIAIKCIQARKQAAMSSSTPQQRAFYARSVYHFAIACESLELYQQAHEWAQRFIRDPIVVKSLYQSPYDERKLLSGIPERINEEVTAIDFHHRVELANQILSGLFKRACLALREPSFSKYHWHGTLCLFFHTVRHRIERSKDIKDRLRLSEEELYDVLWEDTLTVLIAVEEKAILPSHSRLDFNSLGGILAFQHATLPPLKNALPSTYRFLDTLAKARDDLWRKHRPTCHPAVTSLPDPFPRGLPIQHLTTPFILDSPSLGILAPYIASRRDAAVFLRPGLAQRVVPADDETLHAIGKFVDDYYFAFELLLPTMLSRKEKLQQRDRVWAHAIGPLSQGRMSPGEALRYWHTTKVYMNVPLCKTEDEMWPLLPKFHDSASANEVGEWDPLPDGAVKTHNRTLESLTYIDLSKKIWQNSTTAKIGSTMSYDPPTIPAIISEEVWSLTRIHQAKSFPEVREAQMLSSLLYLDTFTSTRSQTLTNAFPSSGDYIRYPALILDEQFLSNLKPRKDLALAALEAHIASVPVPLLEQVAENAMRTLEATSTNADEYVESERLAFMLVQLLGRSDRPELVSNLAVRTIIERPDASSW
jgi:hypothetical protein